MYDLINNWPELDLLKNKYGFIIDKFYNSETNKFEVNIKLLDEEDSEILNISVEFVINSITEKGSCYCYVNTFDARNEKEIWDGAEVLEIIGRKACDFTNLLNQKNYIMETGRCFPKIKKNN